MKSSKNSKKIKSCGIIGLGKLGKNLLATIYESYDITFALDADQDVCEESRDIFDGIRIIHSFDKIKELPDLLFLTVPDSEIEKVAKIISELFANRLSNSIIIHCSGALSTDALKSAGQFAFGIAALHPYQTFRNIEFDESDAEGIFEDIGWICECHADIKSIIRQFVSKLDGSVVFIDEIENFDRERYHISAVFASNYLLSAIELATEIAHKSGINPSEFIPKISMTTIENVLDNYLEGIEELSIGKDNANNTDSYPIPLTGPISRGDIATIKTHINALRNEDIELKTYVLMGLATAELAFDKGNIPEEVFWEIKGLFLSEINRFYSL